jgi:hypothetical protein
MNATVENPFDSIESAHDFVVLLTATIGEAKRDLQADIEREAAQNLSRRIDARRVALYNLEKVELYMNRSRRVPNDLRTLQQLLFEERRFAGAIKLEETEPINVSAA